MRFSSQRHLLAAAFGAAALILTAAAAAQEPPPAPVSDVNAAAVPSDSGGGRKRVKFDYQLDSRPDPFYPFISKEAAQKDKEEEILDEESGVVLEGMRLFEPGQLRLVAVMGRGQDMIAMAEDVTGKGYILRKDMLIGRRGQIIGIENDRVVILETARTRAGREISNEVVMSLKKEEKK